MDLFRFLFIDHFRLACVAALWFLAGIVLSIIAGKLDLRRLQKLPLYVFRLIVRLFGRQPSLLRMTLTIFLFNGAAMFVYMSSGVYALAPKIIALLTGFNIGVVVFRPADQDDILDSRAPSTAQWLPGPGLTILCGLAVLLLELPCFWYAIAMGVSMGEKVAGRLDAYQAEFELRGSAYGGLLIPVLLLSALCESVAIRGAGALTRAGRRRKGGPSQDDPPK